MDKPQRFRRQLCAAVALAGFCCLAATSAQAQQFDQSLYSGMRWRMIGPFRGGRVLAVTGVPGQPNTYYFGAVDGGVWKTTDGGRVWRPVSDQQSIASIGALAVAPSDPNVIYAGTGEADMRSDISFGDGVYKSSDGGNTWSNVGLRDSRHIGRILVDPRNPEIVLVAALGHAYGPNAERGVFRSTDGGKSWQKVLYKDEETGAIDLAFDPDNSQVVYATLWRTRRPPWSTYQPLGGPGSGLYKSTDSGTTWEQLTGHGLPAGEWGRAGVAVARGENGNRVYALIDAPEGGLFRSDDAGANWQRVRTDPRIRERAWYFSGVVVDPNNPDIVYLPNVSLARSTDGGRSFTLIKGAPGGDDYHSLWIDPENSARMIVGCDQGATISVDGGKTWGSWYNQPTAQFYHVTTDNRFPYYIYGAQQDSGTAAVPSRSDYGQISFRDWYSVGGGESGYIVPDPTDPDIVYAGGTLGALSRFNKRTGQTQNIAPWPLLDFGVDLSQRKYRFTWTSPLAFSPSDPRVLYMGAQFVLKTSDGGMSWQAISPDITGREEKAQTAASSSALSVVNAKARGYGVIYTIAPSPAAAGQIWAGTDDGLVWLTRDGGKTWQNVTPQELTDWSKVSLIAASPHDAATAYAAVDRHRLDDLQPYIFRTHNYGKTWTKITEGIAAPAYVHAVREDSERKGLLFAGTETGVYVSFDDGDHWQSLQLNLPATSVRDLVVHGDDLVVATHGRSFWVLDDLTPLRQIDAKVAAASAYLFRPATAVRVRRSVNADTPLPPETPVGANPPSGAIIDYIFRSAPQGDIVLEIFDAKGRLVRRFSTADRPREPNNQLPFPSYWLPPPPPLAKNAGMNRFVWDLRYPSPPALSPGYSASAIIGQGTLPLPEGPLVLPGNYEIRLSVAGQTFRRPLAVKMDPRVTTSPADLAKQFDLGMKISEALEQDHRAFTQLQKLRSQLAALEQRLKTKKGAEAIRSAGQSLERNAAAIAGDAQQFPFAPGTLAAVNGDLASLAIVVDSADGAPTSQAYMAFEQLRQSFAALLARWEELGRHDVPALNELIRRSRISPVGIAFRPARRPSGM